MTYFVDCDLHEIDSRVGSVSPRFVFVEMNIASIAREKRVGENSRFPVKRLVVTVSPGGRKGSKSYNLQLGMSCKFEMNTRIWEAEMGACSL